MRHRLLTLLIFLGVLAVWSRFVVPDTARAMSTIIVNSEDDDVIPATDGFCTLREAILNANDNAATYADCAAGSAADTIIVDIPFAYIPLDSDLPNITDDLTIRPSIPFSLDIDGDNLYTPFTIDAGVTVSLNQFYISYAAGDFGGAIFNAGTLNLTSLTFSSGEADYGAAVYNTGTLTVYDTEFYANLANADGGSIYNDGGSVSITDSYFAFDEAENGGSLYNLGGTVTLNNATFEDFGTLDRGGAIYNEGTLNVFESLFQYVNFDELPEDGGAIYNNVGASLRVVDSVFNNLEVDNRGGAIFLEEAGAAGTAVITGSMFESIYAGFADGGAIHSRMDDLVIANSLFSVDYSDQAAVVVRSSDATIYNSTFAYGGTGIRAIDSTVTLNHNTIIEQDSYGLTLDSTSVANVANTIFENTFATGECDLPTGALLTDLGGNLATDSSCSLTAGNNTAASMLYIAPNGGWMLSAALPGGSPAIGNATGPAPLDLADVNNNSNTAETAPFDMRGDGFLRTVGGVRDSGAFQTNTSFINLIVDRLDDTAAGACTPAPNDCTLRGAIDLANRLGGGVEITFSVTGVIEVDLLGAFQQFRETGSMIIGASMDIVGPGAGLLTVRESAVELTEIRGVGLGELNSIFAITPFSGSFAPMTERSKLADQTSFSRLAGAEPVDPLQVSLIDFTVEGGSSIFGGGVAVLGGFFGPSGVGFSTEEDDISLYLKGMHFTNNEALFGGAVASLSFGSLLVEGSVFENNVAFSLPVCGCAFAPESLLAQMRAPKDRTYKPAAGIGFFDIGSGGAIATFSPSNIIFDSLFAYNRTGPNGAGGAILAVDLFGVRGPVGAERFPDFEPSIYIPLSIYNTTFYGNDTFTGSISYGYPLFRAPLTPSGMGGAIYTSNITALYNVTFAANQSGEGTSLFIDPDYVSAPLYVTNTLFQDAAAESDCSDEGDLLITNASLGTDDTCDADENVSPVLDPLGLQDNGGRSRTVAILPGSEAVNAGDNTLIPDLFDVDDDDDIDEFHPYDQRGAPFVRISGGGIDIGAYELQGETSELTAILTPDPVDVTEGATIGDFICVTLDPAPTEDVTVRVQVAASASSRLTLVDPSNPAVVNSFFDIFFDVGTVDPTVCNPGQRLGVRAIFDAADPFGMETLTGAIEALDGTTLLTSADVNVHDPGVELTPFVPNPAQEGGSASYSIALSGPPGIRNAAGEYETVTVNLRSYNTRFITPDLTSLTFTRADWNTPQTVNIAVIEDNVDRGNLYNTSITHPTASNVVAPYDSRYGGPTPNIAAVRARFTTADNDLRDGEPLSDAYYDALNLAAWLDLQASGAVALEGASAYVLNVRLNGQPVEGEHVVIDLSSIEGVIAMPAQIVFTAHNWDIYQPVQIAVVPDGETQGLREVPLQVFITPDSSAQDFVGAADVVLVAITDDPNGVPIVPALPEMMPQPLAPEAEPNTSAEGSVTE